MKFIKLLLAEAGDTRGWILLTSILPGITQGISIAIISTAADNGQTQRLQLQLLMLFVTSSAISLFSMNRALNATNALIEKFLNRARTETTEKVRHLNLAAYERIGQSRISTVLSLDLQTISNAAPWVITAASASLMLFCCALYIAFLSELALLVTLILFTCGIYVYTRSQKDAAPTWKTATDCEFEFQKNLSHLLNGFKEVKMSSTRGDDLMDNYVQLKSFETEQWKVEAGRQLNAGMTLSNIFVYMVIGAVVFGVPQHIGNIAIAGRIITVIAYASGALDPILKALPAIAKANVALESLEKLLADLAEVEKVPEAPVQYLVPTLERAIEGRDLTYSYCDSQGKATFTFGPCSLRIAAGEIVFVVGGNGSGKSTLIKLLTSLYEPQSGSLFCDDTRVMRTNANTYRNLFSVVFSDFHLFDRLYGMNTLESSQIDRLLSEMNLHEKVSVTDGRFSTLDLSTGQRKRLAMIVARLENKQVYVFDEWAADQDSQFRRYYYEVLLPALRAEGRTLLVITHDDRFFHIADRVVVMDEGRIVRVEEQK